MPANPTDPASPRQTFAIFCATGKDWRGRDLTYEMAHKILSGVSHLKGKKAEALALAEQIFNGDTSPLAVTPVPVASVLPLKIYQDACAAGIAAGQACKPIAMVVGTPTSFLGSELDRTKPVEIVEGGVCGFAWITIKPARGKFVSWCKENKLGSTSSMGGFTIWVSEFGQSMARKEEYARAFAKVLNQHGINAYADSRID